MAVCFYSALPVTASPAGSNSRPVRGFAVDGCIVTAAPDVALRIGLPEFVITRKKANFNINPQRWDLPGAVIGRGAEQPLADEEMPEDPVLAAGN